MMIMLTMKFSDSEPETEGKIKKTESHLSTDSESGSAKKQDRKSDICAARKGL
jgi:hypothetical protein